MEKDNEIQLTKKQNGLESKNYKSPPSPELCLEFGQTETLALGPYSTAGHCTHGRTHTTVVSLISF